MVEVVGGMWWVAAGGTTVTLSRRCSISSLAQHELARLTLQTCLQARSLKQSFVSCSRVKRIACKRDTKSTQIRNGMYDTNFFPAASGR